MQIIRPFLVFLLILGFTFNSCTRTTPEQTVIRSERIEILFLGHNSEHHHSEKLAPILSAALFKKGINISYTADPDDLNPEKLNQYDGLIIYANHDEITPSQEKALLDFVEKGGGFIPIHSASYCFRNSQKYVELVGAQFKSHDTGTFVAKIINNSHPITKDLQEFETWDETYVHHQHNQDREVLMVREENGHQEPWTWTRTHGAGRVFYTAYGHDERTWSHPGFHALVENGILWAVGDEAQEMLSQLELPELEYSEAVIPNYEKRDPPPQFQHPLTPDESRRLIQTPPGFELELFASEPDIINPIAMAWDERGRLWVIETVDYPNTVRDDSGEGDDRIKICEDTNGDGKADKFTVFAENLNIPTSLVFANGGVVVSQAPHLLFLKDTNGDDKADVREELITGWGTYDTHAGPSNLKYGLDNMLWGTVGYSGFNGTIGGQQMQFGQGVYRFTPDGQHLEFLSRTSNNTWGLGFSETFDVFISTANNTHSAYLSVPDRYFVNLTGMGGKGITKIDGHYDMRTLTPNIRQVDVHGGFTAAAGHNLYTARDYPKEYWNRIAFVCEPTGRLLHQAIMEPKGAGFEEKDGWNLMGSADEWFGPVHAEVGPDGAVWVLDWYNFIIQHNPTPTPERGGFQAENGKGNAYIDPLRDKEHGRIYRVKYNKARPYQPLDLSQNDPQKLISALKHDNMFWRTTAQRLIVESGNKEILPDLYKIARNKSVDEIGLNSPAVHALWTMHGLGALDGSNNEAYKVAAEALSHPAAGVRKAAVQVLPRDENSLASISNSKILQDEDLHTRLAAFMAIADMPSTERTGETLYNLSKNDENAKDQWMEKALYAAIDKHNSGFLAAFEKSGEKEVSEFGEGSIAQQYKYRTSFEVFPLERGDQLKGNSAPAVAGKEIIFTAQIEKGDNPLEGMVVTQGGRGNGYALYIQDGKMNWMVKQNNKTYRISSPAALPEKFKVTAKLAKEGQMSLELNDRQVATGKAAALFQNSLDNDLRFGNTDTGDNKLEDFGGWFGFNGKISNASLELKVPGQADAKGEPDQVVYIKVVENVMKYDKTDFTVQAGTEVEIIFENPDFMQHNLVIVQIGSLEKVGEAADRLAREPDAIEKEYVPEMPEVLFATPLIDPEGSTRLRFTVPDKAGDYPFVCTFPGHWRVMNGIMKVTPASKASLK